MVEGWADFQCPFCGLFTHGLEPTTVREFVPAGTARLVFRAFPFLGPASMTAAVAARCARQQGTFGRFRDLRFASQNGENQGTFNDALMAQLARYLGLDATACSTCVRDPSIARAVDASRAQVEASRAQVEQLGVAGTPTPISLPTPLMTPTPAPRTSPVASAAR